MTKPECRFSNRAGPRVGRESMKVVALGLEKRSNPSSDANALPRTARSLRLLVPFEGETRRIAAEWQAGALGHKKGVVAADRQNVAKAVRDQQDRRVLGEAVIRFELGNGR